MEEVSFSGKRKHTSKRRGAGGWYSKDKGNEKARVSQMFHAKGSKQVT